MVVATLSRFRSLVQQGGWLFLTLLMLASPAFARPWELRSRSDLLQKSAADLRTRFGLIGIALTGYGMEEDYHRSQAAGFIAHLTKPVSVRALETGLAAAAAYVKQ